MKAQDGVWTRLNYQRQIAKQTDRYLLENWGQPLVGFWVPNTRRVVDPKDNREKFVMYTFVYTASEKGHLIILDPKTRQQEAYEIPVDMGGWGFVEYPKGHLLMGTCDQGGYLIRFDLAKRQFWKPLRVESETYLWQVIKGSDGMVYGGTYPNCKLLRYDPENHQLEDLGRIDNDNAYLRTIVDTGHRKLLMQAAYHKPRLYVFDEETRTSKVFMEGVWWPSNAVNDRLRLRQGEEKFIVLDTEILQEADPGFPEPVDKEGWGWPVTQEVNGTKKYYFVKGSDWYLWNTETNTVSKSFTMPEHKGSQHITELSLGKFVGVRVPEWILLDPQKGKIKRYRIRQDVAGSDTLEMFTLDDKNRLWLVGASATFLSRVDLEKKEVVNIGPLQNTPVQPFGMVFHKGKLWLAVYSTAELMVYDPEAPYDEWNNVNPHILGNAKPFCRPSGNSVVGPDGGIWTGFGAAYGKVGHCLSRVDPETLEIALFENMVPQQGMNHGCLSTDKQYIYYSTNHTGDGGAHADSGHSVVVWDPFAKKVVHVGTYSIETALGFTQPVNEMLYYRKDDRIVRFSLREMKPVLESRPSELAVGNWCNDMVMGKGGRIYTFWVTASNKDMIATTELYLYTPDKDSYELIASELPKFVLSRGCLVEQTGRLYFLAGTDLMCLTVRKPHK